MTRFLQSLKRVIRGNPQRLTPRLLIIGAQKAGTSALYKMLAHHPSFCPSTIKELHFFNREENYAKGMGHYLSHFPARTKQNSQSVAFEATPAYLFFADRTAPRIRQHLPGATCIAILRDPVKRAYSAWNMYRDFKDSPIYGHLHDPRSFAQAVEDELAGRTEHHYHKYLARGNYAEQIAAFQANLPEDKLLVRSYLQLKREPGTLVGELCSRIGVPPMPETVRLSEVKANARTYPAPLDKGLAAELYRYFAPGMERLQEVLGHELDILENQD